MNRKIDFSKEYGNIDYYIDELNGDFIILNSINYNSEYYLRFKHQSLKLNVLKVNHLITFEPMFFIIRNELKFNIYGNILPNNEVDLDLLKYKVNNEFKRLWKKYVEVDESLLSNEDKTIRHNLEILIELVKKENKL